jgi:tetratricopeptide (TPR) repeat protein
LDRGILDSAHSEIMKAIALRPDYAPNYSMLALILAKQERLDDAMEASLKAVEHAPANIWVNLDAGMFLYALKRIPEAIEHLAIAVKYNPESARAHYFYGLALKAVNQPAKALVQYNEALRCDPAYVDAYNNRGLIHFNAGRTEMAITDCSRAIELEPKATYFHNRAIAFLSLHDSDRAMRDLDSAARIEPTDGTIWYVRGNILQQKNETEMALASFDKALTAEKTCLQALEPFCNILFSLNKHDKAVQRLSTMIARDPQNMQLFNWRGLANMYQGQIDKAVADFDFVIAKAPTEANAYFYKALCLETQGFRDAAVENFSLSIKFGDPKSEQYSIARQRINKLK